MNSHIEPTRGRHKRAQQDVVPRDKVLNAAATLFRERGYKGTTVRDIAEIVGILSGSLFHHFRSKEEMLVTIMYNAAHSMCAHAEAILAEHSTPRKRLRALIGFEIDCYIGTTTRDYYAALILEWRHVPKAAKPELIALRRKYMDTWLAVLTDCEREGALRAEADRTAYTLHSAIVGAITWHKPVVPYSVDEYADILARLVQN